MAKFLEKLLMFAVREPEKSGGLVLKIIIGVVAFLLIIAICALESIATLADGGRLINEFFNIEEEDIFVNINDTYNKYQADVQSTMNTREQEIIKQNTKVVETTETAVNGGDLVVEKEVCTVTVSKEVAKINAAYALAYINYKHSVKDGEKYKYDEDEILTFFETISSIKEEVDGSHYSLYTVIMTPEDVAKEFFEGDTERKSYVESYNIYLSFLDYMDTSVTETDGGEGTGEHYTYLQEDEITGILEKIQDDTGRQIVEFALSKLGSPYSQEKRHDGVHFDCSSLCYYAYKNAGFDITYEGMTTAAALCNYCDVNNQAIAYTELQPGDLIFYSFKKNGRYKDITHVGIYAGDGKIIDASSSKGYVVYRNVYSEASIVSCGRPR